MMRPTKEKNLAWVFHEKLSLGSNQYAEFGVIKEVGEDDRYLWIESENGTRVQKSKSYASWKRTKEKMLGYKEAGRFVVTRTGAGWDTNRWFSDAWNSNTLLHLPEDAGPESQAIIVNTRLALLRLEEYGRYQDRLELEETQEELRKHKERFEQLTPEQKKESDVATSMIGDTWTNWITEPERPFAAVGAAYNNGRLGHVDKVFALRLGIDITNRKRIKTNIIGRGHDNYLQVELLDYNDLECEIAVKKATKGDAAGQWFIASVNRPKKDKKFKWFDLEKQHGVDQCKDLDYPLDFFLDWHKKLSDLM